MGLLYQEVCACLCGLACAVQVRLQFDGEPLDLSKNAAGNDLEDEDCIEMTNV